MNPNVYAAALIAVAALVTIGIRALPFFIFDRGQEVPGWITYLGKVLPPAVMSVLLIYCVRGVDLMTGNHGLPEIGCIGITMILHAWKRNTLLSICTGTILYMVVVQLL